MERASGRSSQVATRPSAWFWWQPCHLIRRSRCLACVCVTDGVLGGDNVLFSATRKCGIPTSTEGRDEVPEGTMEPIPRSITGRASSSRDARRRDDGPDAAQVAVRRQLLDLLTPARRLSSEVIHFAARQSLSKTQSNANLIQYAEW